MKIVQALAQRFRCFGKGSDSSIIPGNPVAIALEDRPLQFAAGVSVEEVVDFIMEAPVDMAKRAGTYMNIRVYPYRRVYAWWGEEEDESEGNGQHAFREAIEGLLT